MATFNRERERERERDWLIDWLIYLLGHGEP